MRYDVGDNGSGLNDGFSGGMGRCTLISRGSLHSSTETELSMVPASALIITASAVSSMMLDVRSNGKMQYGMDSCLAVHYICTCSYQPVHLLISLSILLLLLSQDRSCTMQNTYPCSTEESSPQK